MSERIEIYDTTCRDGAQALDVKLELDDKIRIARLDDTMGIHVVELGYPASNHTDRQVFNALNERPLRHTKVAAFGMTRRKGVAAEEDEMLQTLVDVPADIVTIVGKSSRFQVEQVLSATPEENLRMIDETVRYLRQQGKDRILFDAEHFFDGWYGTKHRHGIPESYQYPGDPEYAMRTLETAVEAGAQGVVHCDTNGYSTPEQVFEATESVRRQLGNVMIGIHPHNDRGLATANMLAAVRAGARHVQATWGDIGERSGNLGIETAMMNLKLEGYDIPDTRQLTYASEEAASFTRKEADPCKPFVGRNAFVHKGGMHASGMERLPAAYEGMPPETVGNRRIIVGSEQAGLASIRSVVERLTVVPEKLRSEILASQNLQRAILAAVKERESGGISFDRADASMTLLVLETVGGYKRLIGDIDSEVTERLRRVTRATIEVQINGTGETYHEVARGGGPLGSLDTALRKALVQHRPELKNHRLIGYRTKLPSASHGGTSSVIQVLMECTDGQDHWHTTGAHASSTTAGWDALLDSYEYMLLKNAHRA